MKFPTKEQVNHVREMYTSGTRVELVSMSDPYTTLAEGSQGTADFVDDTGTLFVKWDCGSRLGVVYGEDRVKRV